MHVTLEERYQVGHIDRAQQRREERKLAEAVTTCAVRKGLALLRLDHELAATAIVLIRVDGEEALVVEALGEGVGGEEDDEHANRLLLPRRKVLRDGHRVVLRHIPVPRQGLYGVGG
eukprot:2405152-Prymnesium_polylepis.1